MLLSPYCPVLLTVGQLPQFQPSPPSPIMAAKGGQVSIPCRATGNPEPVIKWFVGNNRSPLQNDTKYKIAVDGTLQIKNIGKQDPTTYKCTAENLAGTIARNTSVELACKSNFSFQLNITSSKCRVNYQGEDHGNALRNKCNNFITFVGWGTRPEM